MTDRWLTILAREWGMPRLVLIRTLRLPCHLSRALAEWIVAEGQAEGNRAFDDPFGHEPKGDTLQGRIARAQYQRRKEQARFDWERDTTPDHETEQAQAAAYAALRSGATP